MSEPRQAFSRQALLDWLNDLLKLHLTGVEQCGTGAALCQIFDSIYGDVPMRKVRFNAHAEWQYIENFKVLTALFREKKIDRPIDVLALVKCRMQDNLEFLQWTKNFWDLNYPGGEYNALVRRGVQPSEVGGHPKEPIRNSGRRGAASKQGTTPTTGGAATRTRTPLGGASAVLQQENAQLKESVVGLEKERDFYFSKLRDIELLVQKAVEETPELEEDEGGLVPLIQQILYSTEDGFVIPDEGEDLETF